MKKNKIVKYVIFTMLMSLSNVLIVNAAGNEYLECGNSSFPAPLAPMIRVTIILLQVLAPIIIIVAGSLDFLKAVIAKNAEEMKKHQNQFLNRLKAGATVFFVITLVKLVVSFAASGMDDEGIDEKSVTKCLDCLLNNEASCGEITTDNPLIPIEDEDSDEDEDNTK